MGDFDEAPLGAPKPHAQHTQHYHLWFVSCHYVLPQELRRVNVDGLIQAGSGLRVFDHLNKRLGIIKRLTCQSDLEDSTEESPQNIIISRSLF